MGKGKGGETKTQIDPQLQAASLDALDYAASAARLPFTPNRGVQIAAPTSQMVSSMQGSNSAASAFGLGSAPLNLPGAEQTSNGISGYSTGGIYDQSLNSSYSPGMRQSIDELFADPKSGLIREHRSPLHQPHYGGGKGQPQRPGLADRQPYQSASATPNSAAEILSKYTHSLDR